MSAAVMKPTTAQQQADAADQGDKTVATLKARLALHGYALHIVGNHWGRHEFLVMRWNLSRTLQSLDEVRAFLVQIGDTTE